MESEKQPNRSRLVTALMETFGLTPSAAFIVSLFIMVICAAVLIWVVLSAPPRTITLTSGPDGSTFARYAEGEGPGILTNYKKALAARGITLNVVKSSGSLENLQRLRDKKSGVDIGFVQGGLTEGVAPKSLVSLGSVAYQPLWLFYRSATPLQRLSELVGKKIAIGPIGSGTHALAITLLQANAVTGENATFTEDDATAAATALQAGKVDAVFLMGDSAPIQILRTLIRSDSIQMYDWIQADAYSRRFAYLNKMKLPQGSIDLGKNLPAHDISVVGPTVELVARKGLNAALSDALLDAAREVHGRANILQKAGEFPAPLEHEFTLSDDAQRYYKSGKSFWFRVLPYWLAGLVSPILVALVPALLVLIPALRSLPVLYRLRIRLRIYRCYRPLLQLERETLTALTHDRARELLQRLDDIEHLADRLRVPASFGDQFYELRSHILFVRNRLKAALQAPQPAR